MKKYDTYKDSGIQWIGQVPEHWATFPLSKYITLQKGRKPDEFTTEGDLPYVTMDYLRGRENTTCQYPVSVENLIPIDENDLLLLWDGANAGEVVKAKQGYLASTMAVLKFADKIGSTQFLFYYLKSLEAIFKTFANGTTIPHFDSLVLFDYKYPLPPLSEQEAIANFLDKKTGEIDQAIALFEQEKSDLQAYRKAIISETVTKGLNPNAKLKDSGIQWIGQIPEEWSVVKMKYCFEDIYSGESIRAEELDEDGKYPVYGGGAIISHANKYNVCAGDIIIGRVGANCGCVTYLTQNSWATDNALVVKSAIDSRYLFHQLIAADLNSLNSSNAQPLITASKVKDVKIACPKSISDQKEIAEYIDKKTSDIDTAIERINTQIVDLQAYRTALISEAVTGKIDVRL